MIIECPHCLTRFRLDDRRLSHSRAMLKCSHCQRIFPAPHQKTPSNPPRRSPAPPEESLSFSFGDEDEWEQQEPSAENDVPEERFLFNVAGPVAPEQPPAPGAARATAPTHRAPADEEELEEEDLNDEDSLVSSSGSISLRPVFVFLLVVVAAYGVLARTLYANPKWAQRMARNLPVLGGDFQDRVLDQSVALIGVEGHYERTKEGKLVFLVTGKAVNQSEVSLNTVQVLTKLFDDSDNLVDQQTTYCGSSVRLDLIRDLSVRQVAILKSLKPPRRFGIQPGEKCPFVGIFTDVPPIVHTFTAEVLRAQRHV